MEEKKALILHFWPIIKIYSFMGHFSLYLDQENIFTPHKNVYIILKYILSFALIQGLHALPQHNIEKGDEGKGCDS